VFIHNVHRPFPAKLNRCITAACSRIVAIFSRPLRLGWQWRFGMTNLIIPVLAVIPLDATSKNSTPSIPAVVLATTPLSAAPRVDKPALVLALSVEWPTAGAQYNNREDNQQIKADDTDETWANELDVDFSKLNIAKQNPVDNSYSNETEYIGYFDAEGCYEYQFDQRPPEPPQFGTPPPPPVQSNTNRKQPVISPGQRKTGPKKPLLNFSDDPSRSTQSDFANDWRNTHPRPTFEPNPESHATPRQPKRDYISNGRFVRTMAATNRMCSNGFSGNFMNWASSSALDMLRLALTGGDRYIDTPERTILQRASLPGEGSHCMWNSSHFPAKQLSRAGGSSGRAFFGAVPSTMATAAGTNDIWISNMLDRIYFRAGSASSGNCSNQTGYTLGSGDLNDEGFFYARVQVCNTDRAGILQDVRDYGLCKKYPNGNYKPTGVAQKYSEQLRLAVFGYLKDDSNSKKNGRYGGVLRAPMKYVGNKTFDANGSDNTPVDGNPNREWDPNTGVFINNPDKNTSFSKSGVIPYLNQVGRNGKYKVFDPVGELHYEALRYLQGLQPSPAAVSDITAEMYDGFPAITNWGDPYAGRAATSDYSCLKSNIVVIGDTGTFDGDRLPTPDAANNIPDIDHWRSVVQSFEKNQATSYTDGQNAQQTTGNPNETNLSVPSDVTRSQIMGSAYWARTHDIRGRDWTQAPSKQRPGLRVKTFTFDVNERGEQNDPKTRHLANQFFMAAKYGGFETSPTNADLNPYNTWGNPFRREDGTADNAVWADNRPGRIGEAKSYYLQSEARNILTAFDEIFNLASTAERSIAGGAMASKILTQAGTTIYQSSFDTADWSGDLLALPVSVSIDNDITVSKSASWTAATRLAALGAPANSRNIIVGNAGASADPAAAPFTWATPAGRNGIEDALRTALDKPSPNAKADGRAQDRLNYLRGDRSKEGGAFRSRQKLLGDIINSGVAYSGAPSTGLNASNYQAFFSANSTRTPAVFVGANDGMLHAFNATTGDELFAYIPSWLGPKLPALTNATYAGAHQSYVDATPVVGEAQTGSAGTAADWKTVLVSGTGGGGKGVFALDVTTPDQFTAANVMWEFTHVDDPDMGNVIGKPQLLMFRTSAPSAKTPTYKWFAAVGSGVNSHVAESTGQNTGSGKPALFLLDLSKPVAKPWVLGQNYYKISLPIESSLSTRKATGLINFSAALGFSREVAQIYMGDLHGNLWKLDFSPLGSSDWDMNKLSAFKNSAAVPIPFFIAKDTSGNVQPITMSPSITYGPTPETSYVMFGTGKYLELSDKNSTAQQSFYMLYDNGTTVADSSLAGASTISGRKRLREDTATVANASTPGSITAPEFVLGRATSDNDLTQRSGWYFDFPSSGERTLSEATVFGNQIVFGSLVPNRSDSSSGCSGIPGGGSQYTLDIADGAGTSAISNVGIMGKPLIAELNNATTISSTDNTGRRIKTITGQIIQQGASGLSPNRTATKTVITGRLSWRQINNYQDLKNAP
jgi:type IV pilus assembly protein PilY1